MNLYLSPTLYRDTSGLDGLFVRANQANYGDMYIWQKVVKVLPGLYVGFNQPFRDFIGMFERA